MFFKQYLHKLMSSNEQDHKAVEVVFYIEHIMTKYGDNKVP